MSTVHEHEMFTVEELAELHAHTRVLIASGILNSHERAHLMELRDRIDAAIIRQRVAQQEVARR